MAMMGCGISLGKLPPLSPAAKFSTGITSRRISCIVGGSLKRLTEAESFLWHGQLEAAKALFADCRRKQARNFEAYLTKHRTRIVNYAYYQAEQLCSIGSGAVESAVKQIARRLQISGARGKIASVNAMLSLRCAYLNGQLAI